MNYWSQCGGENYKTLSSYSRAITQRRKCLRSKDLSKVKRDKVSILEEYLTNNVASAYSGWVIDTTDFRPYSVPSMKDFKEDPESYKDQLSKTAIFLSDGNLNTPCEPIQQCLPLLSGPISSSSPIYFLFYEDALEEKIQKAMRHCHIKI
jgi:hypothetical protein